MSPRIICRQVTITTFTSTYTISEQKPKGGMTPKQYGEHLMRTGKNKKK